MRTALAVSCLLAASSIAIAQEEEAVLRTYDIRALTRPEGSEQAILRVPIDLPTRLPASGFEEEDPGEGVPLPLGYPTRPIEPSVLEELLLGSSLGFSSGDDQSRWIRLTEGRLVAMAPPEIHERIGGILGALEAALFQQVIVEVHLLDSAAFKEAASSAFLTPSQVEAVLDRHSPSSSQRIQAISGQPVLHQTGELHSYVQDWQVAIAEDSRSGDPNVGVFREGLDIGLTVHPTFDGRHLVRVGARETHLKSMRYVELADEDLGVLQLPAIDTGIVLASGVVASGGGLLLGSPTEERGAWLIRVEAAEDGAAPPTDVGWAMVPLAQLGHPLRIAWLDSLSPERSRTTFGFGQAGKKPDHVGLLDAFALLRDEELSRHVDAGAWRLGDHLLVRGPESARARIAELAQRLASDGDRSLSLELRYGFVDAVSAGELLRSGVVPQQLPSSLEHRVMSATRLDDHFRVVSGTEYSYLKDQDPKVAKQAAIKDPLVDTFFEGLVWEGQLERLRDGRFALDARLHYSQLPEPLDATPRIGGSRSPIDLPRVLGTSARPELVLRPDRWEVLHLGSLPGRDVPKGSRFVCLIRVR